MAQGRELTGSGFPAGFLWGTATAAYQIEGAPRADGKGESIWDRFSHTPGKIARGETGDVADQHYALWRQDLDLMASLHLGAYRFSIAWPRIFPEGAGKPNKAGLDFYSQLVDGLLERGIEPFVTLYHWDLPQALQDRGGWANRDTAGAFADYADAVVKRLGDRVTHWITLNEPSVVTVLGHVTGEHAPGLQDISLVAPVTHHLLLAHGLATQAIRAATPRPTEVGITLNVSVIEPASDRDDDTLAAHLFTGAWQTNFLDAIFNGQYPADMMAIMQALGMQTEFMRVEDMRTIAQPLDFLGLNYYTRSIVQSGRNGNLLPEIVPATGDVTVMDWEVYPRGLRDLLLSVTRSYNPPKLYVTENGAAYPDVIAPDGGVHDAKRIAYLREHFNATREAIREGAPVAGYFVWSFLDNFEWAKGYEPRFGIVYNDFATQKRIVKDSGRFLAEVAETNGARLDRE